MDRIRSHSRLRPSALIGPSLLAAVALLAGGGSSMAAGWLGISVQDISSEIAEAMDLPAKAGALVSEVVSGGPAEMAGLHQQDVITQVDGRDVSSASDLVAYLGLKAPGDLVAVHVLRERSERVFDVRLGAMPPGNSAQSPAIGGSRRDQEETGPGRQEGNEGLEGQAPGREWRLGLQVTSLDESLAPYFRTEPGHGLLVTRVLPGSPAEEAGIRSGDVILAVDGVAVSEPADLRDHVGALEAGDTFTVELLRKGRITRVQGTATPGWMARIPGDARGLRESPRSEYGWNQRQEMIWAHNQLERLEREVRELRRKIEELSKRLERR